METVTLYLDFITESEHSYLLSDGDTRAWLLKSLVTLDEGDDECYEVTMPEWLAKEKALV